MRLNVHFAGLAVKPVSPVRVVRAKAQRTHTTPLAKQELVDYLRNGCKTRDEWRYSFPLVAAVFQCRFSLALAFHRALPVCVQVADAS
jgi:hypothetical protein